MPGFITPVAELQILRQVVADVFSALAGYEREPGATVEREEVSALVHKVLNDRAKLRAVLGLTRFVMNETQYERGEVRIPVGPFAGLVSAVWEVTDDGDMPAGVADLVAQRDALQVAVRPVLDAVSELTESAEYDQGIMTVSPDAFTTLNNAAAGLHMADVDDSGASGPCAHRNLVPGTGEGELVRCEDCRARYVHGRWLWPFRTFGHGEERTIEP